MTQPMGGRNRKPTSPNTNPIFPSPESILTTASIEIDKQTFPLVEVKKAGDLILDVTFSTSQDCTKSIPRGTLRYLRTKKIPFPSPRICFRVQLATLSKYSEYFRLLLSSQFSEGIAVSKTLQALSETNHSPAAFEAEMLPRVAIVDEDFMTKTTGRELIFADLLFVAHGLSPKIRPYTNHCWTVLVLMADNYDLISCISHHLQKEFLNHNYRVSYEMNGEEGLRQKLLTYYHLEKGPRFTSASKDLIMRGCNFSDETGAYSEDQNGAWWNLPYGIESEIEYRRACVLKTIASIQNQFIRLYSSRDRQCKLGYDSSSSCDSFQLGEMVKFLSRKNLLFLLSFQATSSEESTDIWPEAYRGKIDNLINTLRQCPSYQLNQHHKYCGLRTKLIPALNYIKSCIDVELGIKLIHSKGTHSNPSFNSWRPNISRPSKLSKPEWQVVNDDKDTNDLKSEFQFAKAKMDWGVSSKDSRELFTAKSWNWITELEISPERLGKAFGAIR
ncbi:hypothetical protein K3495_g7518 [Podosphaera aphanis]|nr:hypothetical protein K3495_g7518 [Podosphaera aphanis]